MSLVNLFRQIILNNPSIEVLNMLEFSMNNDYVENIGELVLESLLSSKIDTIKNLNLGDNMSWFYKSDTREESSDKINLLAELISKQAGLQEINLGVY